MRRLSQTSRTLLVAAAAAALAVPLSVTAPTIGAAAASGTRQIRYTDWGSQKRLSTGRFEGTRSVQGVLGLTTPLGSLTYDDPYGYPAKRYAFGRWTSPWHRPGFGFEQLIPSWEADTPGDSWVQIQVRGRSAASGRVSKWYTMANWSAGDATFHRTSLGTQADDLARVDVDTLQTRSSVAFGAWQMRVTLLRKAGTRAAPTVDMLGAVVSHLPDVDRVATSRPGVASGITLKVPRYSQMIHQGDYPEYDGGGEAWCSPTSVSMVLGRIGWLPSPEEYSWVPAGHKDPWVDHAARSQFDSGYDGAGNWSFSAAYASTHADTAFVTRLRNLREAERFVKAGIPLVASVSFRAGELSGAPLQASNGHLLVVVGFTSTGDVVVNDPPAHTPRGFGGCTTGASSRTPGCLTRAGWSTWSATSTRPCPGRPAATGEATRHAAN